MTASRAIGLGGVLALVCTATVAAAGGAVSPEDAARFLSQATLGADWDEIQRTAGIGYQEWMDEQFERPIGEHQPAVDALVAAGVDVSQQHRRWSWWKQVMEGPDPLRQRVGLAPSELFVVSDANGTVGNTPQGLANYYDMLLSNAFGNYRDLLRDVTMHPVMGAYLSHLKNAKSSSGRFPDENYAREIMQLFSIGLFELHPDSSFVLDGTGLAFDGVDNDFYQGQQNWTAPMRMYDAFHEPGPKFLLRSAFVPPGQSGMQDVDDAIDNLFEHPNVGLVLLIIFMVIVPLTLRGYDVNVPGEASVTSVDEPRAEQIVLSIDVNGCPVVNPPAAEGLPADCRVRVNEEELPVSRLAARVAEILGPRDAADRVLFLAAHDRLNYEAVMRIIDVAKTATPTLKIGLVIPRGDVSLTADSGTPMPMPDPT